jgi:hypothetical protein
MVIAKTFAENSLTNYLLTIALLLAVSKDADTEADNKHVPVASLVAGVFENMSRAQTEKVIFVKFHPQLDDLYIYFVSFLSFPSLCSPFIHSASL